MAIYTTVQKVQDTLPKAVQSSSNVTSATVAHFIDQADSIINGKLAVTYNIPVNSPNVPGILVTIATDLAAHRLLRRQFTQNIKNKSEWVDQFKDSMDLLDAVAEGKMTLVDSSGDALSRSVARVWSNNQGFDPTFTEDKVSTWEVDDDKFD